ncbi:hypothetical protein F4703DRAFT_1836055 [Phycomyces blakesleeanus]
MKRVLYLSMLCTCRYTAHAYMLFIYLLCVYMPVTRPHNKGSYYNMPVWSNKVSLVFFITPKKIVQSLSNKHVTL